MSELENYFHSRKKSSLFIPYFSLGDPNYEDSIEWGKSILDGGADILELGIPFSDPVADGPVIQKSYKRALDNNPFSMRKIFEVTSTLHQYKSGVPFVYLGYLNPIIRYGLGRFFQDAYAVGIRGMVIPDIPFDAKEYPEIRKKANQAKIDIINLITPATLSDRVKEIGKASGGFIYYVTSYGVTGERKNLDDDLEYRVNKLRKSISIPIACGFGISNAAQAKSISQFSDGVIIGSAIQKIIEENFSNKDHCKKTLHAFVKEVRSQMR
jgi:tryptophan synthase alpha chain